MCVYVLRRMRSGVSLRDGRCEQASARASSSSSRARPSVSSKKNKKKSSRKSLKMNSRNVFLTKERLNNFYFSPSQSPNIPTSSAANKDKHGQKRTRIERRQQPASPGLKTIPFSIQCTSFIGYQYIYIYKKRAPPPPCFFSFFSSIRDIFFSTKQNWAGAKVFNSGNKKLGAEVEKKVKKKSFR